MLDDGILVVEKVYEGVEYIFTFRIEDKITVLEKHAERRLIKASDYADEGNEGKVQNQLQDYAQIKEKQGNLLDKIDDNGQVLGMIEERTIEQQKIMEEIKTKSSGDLKQVVVQTQEQVVNQVAKRVVVTNGTEGQTEFFQKVEHVWAPGTGPGGGPSGVVIEGGVMQFAPGTSVGGPSGSDIKTVEIKTGGAVNEPVPVGGDMNITTDTVLDGPVNTIDDTYDDDNWTIDP